MGRKSITGGVIPAGLSRIRFDFTVDGRVPTSRGSMRKLPPVPSVFPTSFHGTGVYRNFLQPSNIERAEKYSTIFFGTRRLAWREVTWRRLRSPHIGRSSITSGDLTWQMFRSWAFVTRC
jgi:hypothetical protein